VGGLLRRAPLALPPSAGAVVDIIPGTYQAHEVAQMHRIVAWRGGTFKGTPLPDFPGIDGWLDGIAASLKTGNSTNAIANEVVRAEAKAANAGYSAVELFVDSRAVSAAEVLQGVRHSAEVHGVLQSGIISVVNIETRDGWIRLLAGGL
jgi:hypothetical protein